MLAAFMADVKQIRKGGEQARDGQGCSLLRGGAMPATCLVGRMDLGTREPCTTGRAWS